MGTNTPNIQNALPRVNSPRQSWPIHFMIIPRSLVVLYSNHLERQHPGIN
jgi:hypothetical protein